MIRFESSFEYIWEKVGAFLYRAAEFRGLACEATAESRKPVINLDGVQTKGRSGRIYAEFPRPFPGVRIKGQRPNFVEILVSDSELRELTITVHSSASFHSPEIITTTRTEDMDVAIQRIQDLLDVILDSFAYGRGY